MTPDPGTKPRLWHRAAAVVRFRGEHKTAVVKRAKPRKGGPVPPPAIETYTTPAPLKEGDRRKVQTQYWRAKRARKSRRRRSA